MSPTVLDLGSGKVVLIGSVATPKPFRLHVPFAQGLGSQQGAAAGEEDMSAEAVRASTMA